MRIRILAAAALVVALAACHTGETGPPGPTPAPTASPAFLYVADSGNNSVFVFTKRATATELPLRTITSSQLAAPSPIAADPAGRIWVASHGAVPALLEFSSYDSGDTVPLAVMQIASRGLAGDLDVGGMTFGPTGRLYVGTGNTGHVLVYDAAVNGTPVPAQDISGPNTGLSDAEGVALDAAGDIYVASSSASAILEFAPGANGNTAPIREIKGFFHTRLSAPADVAVDAAGDVFALNDNQTITEYAAGANGDVAPIATIGRGGIGRQMVFDGAGNLYVAATSANSQSPVVFAPPITPTSAPIQILTSPVFSAPTGIFAR